MSSDKIEKNNVKNRFLPLPKSVELGLEREPKITDFNIVKELGAGSFGRVYLVTHKITKVQYAIKAIDKRNKTNQEEKPYFRREVEVMYKIHHPNVVKLFGHFEDNNYCYFIMEYISKGSVFSLIPTDKKKRINTQIVASLIKDVISAVYFLHNMKPIIIHRDIKPENVLLAEGMVAKLTDFGWSNYMQEDEKRTTLCGTPIYLAPEIIKEEGHDERVDIWCIGVLLFELSTGSVPFLGNDIETLKRNILNLKITWPKDINTDAKGLIMKILKLDPNSRISLQEMLQHPFITKYFPNAAKELIKPKENAEFKSFIVSKDDPKTWVPEIEPSVTDNNNKPEEAKKETTDNNNNFIEKLKAEIKEKDDKIEKLKNNTSPPNANDSNNNENQLKEKIKELEEKNRQLEEKIKEYETKKNDVKTGNDESENKTADPRDSVTGNANDVASAALEKLKAQLNTDQKYYLTQIIKEKEKEIEKIKEEEKIRREKEKKKYVAIINKYDKTLSHYEKENKELKAKIKELQGK